MRVSQWAILALVMAVPAPALADHFYHGPPVVTYYPPAPVVTYYAPAPVVTYAPPTYYVAPAPVVTYAAPVTTYYSAPAPVGVTTYRYGLLGRRVYTRTRYYYPPRVSYYIYP